MPASFRTFWLPLGVIVYVCFAAAEARGGYLPWLALAVIPLGLALLWRQIRLNTEAQDTVAESAKRALGATYFGFALWLAARSGPLGHPAFDAMANLATGIAAVGALVALARIRTLGGLLIPKPATESMDAAAFTAFLWALAVVLPAARSIAPDWVRIDPLAIDYVTTTAATGTLLVFLAASWRVRILRRYELGAGDRAVGAWAFSLTVFFVALPAALLDVGPPDRVLPSGVLVAALAIAWTATTAEPTRVSSLLRGLLAVLLPGAPLLLLGGALIRQFPAHAGTLFLSALPIATAIGLVARAVAKPLGPEQSRWLDAVEAASRGALEPEPDAAIQATLLALTKATHVVGNRPELWRASPPEVLSVDRAGYLHSEHSSAPERLHELALAEPERTLRREALEAAQVRYPEVRPILAWFEARRAFSATLIVDVDGALGFLLLPRGNRTSAMTLEEARAVRLLADRISALLAISSALARSRERELEARDAALVTESECARLLRIVALDAAKNSSLAETYQGELVRSTYSATSKLTLEHLAQLGRSNSHLFVKSAAGTDATAWLAFAHLASPRAGGPFVVVDGSGSAAHSEHTWDDAERSPLQLVDGGTLVIRHGTSLPAPIQHQIARWLLRQDQRQPGELPAPRLYLTSLNTYNECASTGALSKPLVRWFQGSALSLPCLADRPEDLRALILGHLARFGMALRGEPIGIGEGALRALIEHPWPANDLELQSVLLRATLACTQPTLSLADVLSGGFSSAGDEASLAPDPFVQTVPSDQPKARRRIARTR